MSSEQQEIRRRPFSVNDLNRRTREIKVYNTTTITTTSTTSTHDSTISTTTISNREQTDNSTNAQKKQDSRSKSALGTISNKQEDCTTFIPITNITTNTSISLPCKRKIKFVYGDEHDSNENNIQLNKNKENYDNQTKNSEPVNNISISRMNEKNYNLNENTPAFPCVKTSVLTKTNEAEVTNSVIINTNLLEDYDNFDSNRSCNMRVKDVEVECEIDEDPAIFEGSEGYVKNLINKIQQQYKNPETVHIKITRRQKSDGNGREKSKNKNESYGQIVRKEYYTIKNTSRPKKSSSISSFVDQSNIPFIDDELSAESRNNSTRSTKTNEIRQTINIQPNYIIEKHEIYNENEKEEKENKREKRKKKKM